MLKFRPSQLTKQKRASFNINEQQLVALIEKGLSDNSLRGFLYKRSSTNSKWRLKWFLLFENMLFYFDVGQEAQNYYHEQLSSTSCATTTTTSLAASGEHTPSHQSPLGRSISSLIRRGQARAQQPAPINHRTQRDNQNAATSAEQPQPQPQPPPPPGQPRDNQNDNKENPDDEDPQRGAATCAREPTTRDERFDSSRPGGCDRQQASGSVGVGVGGHRRASSVGVTISEAAGERLERSCGPQASASASASAGVGSTAVRSRARLASDPQNSPLLPLCQIARQGANGNNLAQRHHQQSCSYSALAAASGDSTTTTTTTPGAGGPNADANHHRSRQIASSMQALANSSSPCKQKRTTNCSSISGISSHSFLAHNEQTIGRSTTTTAGKTPPTRNSQTSSNYSSLLNRKIGLIFLEGSYCERLVDSPVLTSEEFTPRLGCATTCAQQANNQYSNQSPWLSMNLQQQQQQQQQQRAGGGTATTWQSAANGPAGVPSPMLASNLNAHNLLSRVTGSCRSSAGDLDVGDLIRVSSDTTKSTSARLSSAKGTEADEQEVSRHAWCLSLVAWAAATRFALLLDASRCSGGQRWWRCLAYRTAWVYLAARSIVAGQIRRARASRKSQAASRESRVARALEGPTWRVNPRPEIITHTHESCRAVRLATRESQRASCVVLCCFISPPLKATRGASRATSAAAAAACARPEGIWRTRRPKTLTYYLSQAHALCGPNLSLLAGLAWRGAWGVGRGVWPGAGRKLHLPARVVVRIAPVGQATGAKLAYSARVGPARADTFSSEARAEFLPPRLWLGVPARRTRRRKRRATRSARAPPRRAAMIDRFDAHEPPAGHCADCAASCRSVGGPVQRTGTLAGWRLAGGRARACRWQSQPLPSHAARTHCGGQIQFRGSRAPPAERSERNLILTSDNGRSGIHCRRCSSSFVLGSRPISARESLCRISPCAAKRAPSLPARLRSINSRAWGREIEPAPPSGAPAPRNSPTSRKRSGGTNRISSICSARANRTAGAPNELGANHSFASGELHCRAPTCQARSIFHRHFCVLAESRSARAFCVNSRKSLLFLRASGRANPSSALQARRAQIAARLSYIISPPADDRPPPRISRASFAVQLSRATLAPCEAHGDQPPLAAGRARSQADGHLLVAGKRTSERARSSSFRLTNLFGRTHALASLFRLGIKTQTRAQPSESATGGRAGGHEFARGPAPQVHQVASAQKSSTRATRLVSRGVSEQLAELTESRSARRHANEAAAAAQLSGPSCRGAGARTSSARPHASSCKKGPRAQQQHGRGCERARVYDPHADRSREALKPRDEGPAMSHDEARGGHGRAGGRTTIRVIQFRHPQCARGAAQHELSSCAQTTTTTTTRHSALGARWLRANELSARGRLAEREPNQGPRSTKTQSRPRRGNANGPRPSARPFTPLRVPVN
ncbi:Hypothetical predicted protein [Olea europaea subsp. europaea]|uniref:PH domain-containing protein n=1 Tax=Olea europaea subsp. europaea TaxID=158383 RepID=A0A8S0TLT5_OLEEU|nr:Hypothetical predicted protein [Olea europaea subsp. europaea]